MLILIMIKLAVLIPGYNEEDSVNFTLNAISKKLNEMIKKKMISRNSFIAFIDDGSSDKTWEVINKFKKNKYNNLKALKLSKNYGHQIALFAGIKEFHSQCDCSISVDADLQHDIGLFDKFIEFFKDDFEMVLAISDQKTESFFKIITANLFYKILNFISFSKIEPNHADFRLLSKKSMEEISKHESKSIFLRGLISSLNFKKKIIKYSVKERKFGKSKYTIFKMIRLALDGITSQSTYPLRISSITGFIILLFCFISSITVFYDYYVNQNTVPGWASTIIPIYFLGGVQIFLLGIIGEYIAKIYKEVKKNPTYSITDKIK